VAQGKSGNPKGAPRRGESWAELIKTIGELTAEEALQRVGHWLSPLKRLPQGVTLKELVVMRAYATLLDESNARLLKEVMERAEGKIKDEVDLNVGGKTINVSVGKDAG